MPDYRELDEDGNQEGNPQKENPKEVLNRVRALHQSKSTMKNTRPDLRNARTLNGTMCNTGALIQSNPILRPSIVKVEQAINEVDHQ